MKKWVFGARHKRASLKVYDSLPVIDVSVINKASQRAHAVVFSTRHAYRLVPRKFLYRSMTLPYQPLNRLPDWTEEEKPFVPGSPSTPSHPLLVRIAYGCVGLLVGITSGLGMSLLSINLPNIQGTMSLTPAQGAYSIAAYSTANACANLLIFKFRQQFGVRLFAEIALSIYAALTLLHLLVNDFNTALLVRGASGFAGAAMTVLGFFYMIQAFPKKHRGKALVIGLGISQLALPIAGIISPMLSNYGQWHVLYRFEAGLALCSLAAVVILKLPPSIHIKAFEWQDIPTILMIIPGLALFFAVLSQGVIQWWVDAPWIAYAWCASIVLTFSALFYEHHRTNQLIYTHWIFQPSTLNFAMGALALRFLLSEQNYGAVNMLKMLGMGPDQLQLFYVVVFFGVLIGIISSAMLFSPKTIFVQTGIALVFIITGSFMDTGSTSLTRPHDMFISQFLIAVACGMFLGPMMLLGIMQVYTKGKHYIISFAILFSLTQNIGGIGGQAIFGTIQQIREREYSALITSHTNLADPQVAQRLQIQAAAYAPYITDPALRNAYSTSRLAAIARQEANIRAYNDIFLLAGSIAVIFLIWSLINLYLAFRNAKQIIKIARLRRKLIIHVIKQYKRNTSHRRNRQRRNRPTATANHA
ncbi:MAG: hypothetical protein MESAZ_01505 [Saezia sanguinis]